MAIKTTVVEGGIWRAGGFVNPILDWTRTVWVWYASAPAGADSYTAWQLVDSYAAVNSYVGAFSYLDVGGFTQDLELSVGGFVAPQFNPIRPQQWNAITARYTAATTTTDYFLNGTLIDSVVLDLSGWVIAGDQRDFLGADSGQGVGGVALAGVGLAYDRWWQAALTDAEIALEIQSAIAVRQVDLLSDAPLANPSDLEDLSGNGRDWTAPEALVWLGGPPLPDTTDLDQLEEIAWRTIEDTDFSSRMWTREEVVGYFNQRQDRFNRDTLLILAQQPVAVEAGQETVDLPEDWIATQNVSFTDTLTGTTGTVNKGDQYAADLGLGATNNPPLRPISYDDQAAGTLQLRLFPAPLTDGQIDLLYACVLESLDFDANLPEIIDLPGDFVPYVTYGVLADMFSKEGQGRDLARAKYCESRYQEGVELARFLLMGFL